MEESHPNEGSRPSNRRRGPSRLFFRSLTALVVIIAIGLILALIQLGRMHRDLQSLQETIAELDLSPRESAPSAPRRDDTPPGASAEELHEWAATLRSEIAKTRTDSAQSLAEARTAATQDRHDLFKILARILHAHGASQEEIYAIAENLDPVDRRDLLSELSETPPAPTPTDDSTGTPTGTPGDGTTDGTTDDSTDTPPDVLETSPTPPDDEEPEDVPPTVPNPEATAADDSNPDDPPLLPPKDGTETPEPADSPDEDSGDEDSDDADSGEAVVIHTVRRGDTVSEIAQKYDADEQAILKANKITNPRAIQIGQKLVIPKE